MNEILSKRLDEILPRVTNPKLLSSTGIGNEIACYIFDYAAADELQVRDHIAWMKDHLEVKHANLRVLHLDLFDVILAHLEARGLLTRALEMQKTRGDAAVLEALEAPLAGEKIRDAIEAAYKPSEHDLVLMSGVGSIWPMLRVHSLLNCLHTVLGSTPLVMFYPGTFDGTSLRLFGRIMNHERTPGAKNYYRAFLLVPPEVTP